MSIDATIRALQLADSTTRGMGFLSVIDPLDGSHADRTWLPIREAAKAMHVSDKTIRRYASAGKLLQRRVPSRYGEMVEILMPAAAAPASTSRLRCPHWHCPDPQAHNLGPKPSDWSRAGQAAFLLLIGALLCWLAFAAGVL